MALRGTDAPRENKLLTAMAAKGIDNDAIEQLRATASDIYNEIGHDLAAFDEDEIADCLRDRMHDALDEADLLRWNRLTGEEKIWLVKGVI